MSDLFTVKLDLSTVTQNESEKLYILMVDPLRMKMIYQFKLWVRFLFSIDCPIKLIYEGASIHDLEDVHILKLLKIVHVERADYGVGEREQHEELIAKLNRYDEWHDSVTPAITPQKQCELVNGHGFQTQNKQFHHSGITHIDGNECNLSNTGCEHRHKAPVKSPSCNNPQAKAESNSKITNDKFDTSSNSCSLSGNEFIPEYYNNQCKSKIYSQKNNIPNATVNSTPKIVTESAKTSNGTNKQESSIKRRSAHKPFSLFNFLQTLRSQESNFDDSSSKRKDDAVDMEKNVDFETSDVMQNNNLPNNENEGEGRLIKRKRKRIRKHKNQKNKHISEPYIPPQTLTPMFHDKQKMKSVSVSPKPKHIRFDANEDSVDFVVHKPVLEESNIVNVHTNECLYNSKPELSNDANVDVMASVQQDDVFHESNSVTAPTVQVINKTIENGDNEVDVKDVSMISDDKDVKNGSLSDSPQSILDILGSLRKKSNTPVVFDRFASCT